MLPEPVVPNRLPAELPEPEATGPEPPDLNPSVPETAPEPPATEPLPVELPPPEPPVVPAPRQRPAPPQPGEQEPRTPPQIPERDWREREVSFLEGCWRLASDYRITRRDTGQVFAAREWRMCFDRNGAGSQTLEFENGARCESAVQAEFAPDGSLLVIDGGDVPCDNGSNIDRRIMQCQRQADGTADCVTRHTRPPAYPVPVRFGR